MVFDERTQWFSMEDWVMDAAGMSGWGVAFGSLTGGTQVGFWKEDLGGNFITAVNTIAMSQSLQERPSSCGQ